MRPAVPAVDDRSVLIDVALVPAEARRWRDAVCIVIDELRASSTIVTLLERGAAAVVPAANVAEARRLAAGTTALLAGERNVIRAPGFDFGNSPTEIDGADLAGRSVVLSTRNGNAVMRALRPETVVLVGCLLNARACAGAALDLAREGGRMIGVVCAGRGGTFAMDDALTAGCLVDGLLAAADDAVELTDAARAAHQLWRATPDIGAAFRASASGRQLARHEFGADLEYCLTVNASAVVPELRRTIPPRIERLA